MVRVGEGTIEVGGFVVGQDVLVGDTAVNEVDWVAVC